MSVSYTLQAAADENGDDGDDDDDDNMASRLATSHGPTCQLQAKEHHSYDSSISPSAR